MATPKMEYVQLVIITSWKVFLLTSYRLGNSGLKISKVVLGCMGYGDPRWQGWVLDEEKSLPLIHHAYKQGINTWDTVSFFTSLFYATFVNVCSGRLLLARCL